MNMISNKIKSKKKKNLSSKWIIYHNMETRTPFKELVFIYSSMCKELQINEIPVNPLLVAKL